MVLKKSRRLIDWLFFICAGPCLKVETDPREEVDSGARSTKVGSGETASICADAVPAIR
jgi:hypothetical protein